MIAPQVSGPLHDAGAKALDQLVDRNLQATRATISVWHEAELSAITLCSEIVGGKTNQPKRPRVRHLGQQLDGSVEQCRSDIRRLG
jgi:hypothetical protein